jgi:hypothetical protein
LRFGRRPLLRGTLACAVLTAWALVYLRPIWRVYPDHITPSRGDAVFNLYILKWSARQVRLGLPDPWRANFFYPEPAALTLSDHLLGPAAAFALLEAALPDAVAAYNALFFASFVLAGATTAWVMRKSGCSLPASILAGGMYAFAPFRLAHVNHIQLLLAQWIPLTLWHWDRLLAERTARRAALFLAFYLLQVTGGCYLAYMIHVPLLVLALNRLAGPGGRELKLRASLAVLLLTCALALAAAATVFLPYARSAARLGLARDLPEIVDNGAMLASYLAPSPGHETGYALYKALGGVPRRGIGRTLLHRPENTLTAGFAPTLLALTGGVLLWRGRRTRPAVPLPPRRRLVLAGLAAVAVLAFAAGEVLTLAHGRWPAGSPEVEQALWLSLGFLFLGALAGWLALRRRWGGNWPLGLGELDAWERGLLLSGAVCWLLTFPVAYLPLARLVPGLDGMRVPARFYALVSLSLVFLAARGADALTGRFRSRPARALAWTALALLVAVDLLPRPLRWAPLLPERDFPEVYRWIAARPEVRALVEVPVRPYGGDIMAMYFSTAHWKPIANGFSGYLPATYQEVQRRARDLPGEEGIALLRRLGVTHLVVRTGDLVPRRWRHRSPPPERLLARWERRLVGREVELVHVSGPFRVYRVLAAPAGGSTSGHQPSG